MADPVGPTFVPKAALTAGRVLHQPFEVPTEMTKSALLQGGVTHAAIGSINKAAAEAVNALEPRGPAKFLAKLFGKVDSSLVGSAAQAQRATEAFWVPFSNGAHQIGHAVSNPFSLFYAKRAGFEMPGDPAEAQALLAQITDPDPNSTKFPGFNWPAPAPPAEEPPPADKPPAEEPPPADKPPAEEPPPGDKPPAEEPPPADKPPAEEPTPDEGGGTPPPTEGGGTPPPTDGEGGGTPPVDAAPTDSSVPDGARSLVPVDTSTPATGPIDAAVGADAVAPPAPPAPPVAPMVDDTPPPAPVAPVAPPA